MTAIRISTNDTIRGLYMGCPFSGTVASLDSNESGHADDRNSVRVSIRIDADIVTEAGYTRRSAGDEIIMDCARVPGGRLVRSNDMFSGTTLRRAA